MPIYRLKASYSEELYVNASDEVTAWEEGGPQIDRHFIDYGWDLLQAHEVPPDDPDYAAVLRELGIGPEDVFADEEEDEDD